MDQGRTVADLDTQTKALLLLYEIKKALANGTKHYRVSDGKLLETMEEILGALMDEGSIQFEPVKE